MENILLAFAIMLAGSSIVFVKDSLFTITDVLIFLLAIVVLFSKKTRELHPWAIRNTIYCLIILISLTMMIRGAGLKILGSESQGGAVYLKMISYLLVLLFLPKIHISVQQWKVMVVCFCILFIIPFLVEVLFAFGFSGFGEDYVHTAAQSSDAFQVADLKRLQTGGPLSLFIVLFSFILFPLYKRLNKWHYIFSILAFILAALSGHRLALIGIIIFIFIRLLLDKNIYAKKMIIKFGIVTTIICLLVICLYSEFPIGLQRMFSFLPFTDQTSQAAMDASGSTEWRFIIWQVASEWIPQYFWIGKGVTALAWEVEAANQPGQATLVLGLVTGNYHNGPLALLISFGILGLLLSTALFYTVIRYALFFIKHAEFKNYHDYNLLLCTISLLIQGVIVFFIMYGDLSRVYEDLILYCIIVSGLIIALKREKLALIENE